jgi:hypothetical protein
MIRITGLGVEYLSNRSSPTGVIATNSALLILLRYFYTVYNHKYSELVISASSILMTWFNHVIRIEDVDITGVILECVTE